MGHTSLFYKYSHIVVGPIYYGQSLLFFVVDLLVMVHESIETTS